MFYTFVLEQPMYKIEPMGKIFLEQAFKLKLMFNYLQCRYNYVVSDVSTSTCRTFYRILRYKNEQQMKVKILEPAKIIRCP